jgi:hypothetical protein
MGGGMGLGSALQAGGGMFNALQQYEQGKATQRMYNFQADQALEAGARDERTLRTQTGKLKGSQKVALEANGIFGGVTAEDIARDTDNQMADDILAIQYNAKISAWQAKTAGVNAKKAGAVQGFSTLLNTANQVSDNWKQWKKTSEGKSASKPGNYGMEGRNGL